MFELVTFTKTTYNRYIIEICDYETGQRFSLSTVNARLYEEYLNEDTKQQAIQTAINIVLEYHDFKPQETINA